MEAVLRADLSAALSELDEQRKDESIERVKLGQGFAAVESELLVLRRQRQLARLSTDGRRELLSNLKREKREFEQDSQYLKGIFNDFSVQLKAQLMPGQKAVYEEVLDDTVRLESSLLDRSNVFDLAMDRLESAIGGEINSGNAVASSGMVLHGKVCNIGPASWFISDDGSSAGVLTLGKGAKYARLFPENANSVSQLFEAGRANLELDVTGGKARAIEKIQGDPSKLFKKGGVWLWPILGIALVSAVCGIIKFTQLLQIKEPSQLWVSDILAAVSNGDIEKSREISSAVNHPAGSLISNAIDYVGVGADVVEEVIYEQLIGVQSKLQKWLPFIAVTAATAPLLGLLGTVSGMIRMFNVITVVGTGDVKPMAGGISEALVTTLFGLVVAIPALIIHTMLQRRSNGVVQNTEKLGLTFVNGLRRLS